MHIHILGICGTLMGSIALLARDSGFTVTGSDENVYPPMSDQLANAGIDVTSPYHRDNIPRDAELVILGNANLARGNPAVEYLLDMHIPFVSGAEWLGRYLLQDRWVIAIAGTHGKTTTTSMVAWILEEARLAPGYLVGGVPNNFAASARVGESPFFVIEADEYDTSYFDRRSKFLHYHPQTLVLNNLEYDHADIFPDLEAIRQQFHLLVRTVPGTGLIIRPTDDPELDDVLSRGCWSSQLRFGDGGEISARLLREDASRFVVDVNGEEAGIVDWQCAGRHNLSNALAAIAAARHAGVPPSIACSALHTFTGVKRRLEVIYESEKLIVYDDFAHHPTAIRTTLDGLRRKFGSEQIVAVIELGSHTMKKGTHSEQLKQSAAEADAVYWFKPEIDWDLAAAVETPNQQVISDLDQLLQEVIETVCTDAVSTDAVSTDAVSTDAVSTDAVSTRHLVIMSNSGFGGFQRKLLARLAQVQR